MDTATPSATQFLFMPAYERAHGFTGKTTVYFGFLFMPAYEWALSVQVLFGR